MTNPYPSDGNWPVSFNGCTIKGRFVDLLGVPLAGKTISFVPTPVALLDVSATTIIVPASIQVTLASDGQIKGIDGLGSLGVVVPATDDPDINPMNWTYTVSENWTAGRKNYSIEAPVNGSIDLVDVSPVPSSLGTPIYRGASGIPLGEVAAPATSADQGVAGQMAFASGFLYVCVATNSWKRVAVSSW